LVEPLMLALGADIEVHPVMILGTWARRPRSSSEWPGSTAREHHAPDRS
jgi:hypothetical protein